MPPRKRARVSAASTPQDTTSAEPASIEKAAVAPVDDVLNDPWTDDEYTELFKAMIRWKPTGMHKHFRMISISNALQSHGYSYNTSSGPHTRIPGIWAKLRSLYDLEALDERENRHAGNITPEPSPMGEEMDEEEDLENEPGWHEYSLDEDKFGDLMWERRLERDSSRRDSSPELIEGLNKTRPYPGVHIEAAEADDVAEVKSKGKKPATPSTKVKGKGARASPVQEPEEDEEEEDEDEEEESTPAESPPAREATKASKKQKAASGSRRSKRKR